MTLPTDAELEAAARWACEKIGKSPDELMPYRLEDGVVLPRPAPRWIWWADQMRNHALMNEALALATDVWRNSAEYSAVENYASGTILESGENPWRPIAEADPDKLIEISAPDGPRGFGFFEISAAPPDLIEHFSSSHDTLHHTTRHKAIRDGWIFKEPTSLPESE